MAPSRPGFWESRALDICPASVCCTQTALGTISSASVPLGHDECFKTGLAHLWPGMRALLNFLLQEVFPGSLHYPKPLPFLGSHLFDMRLSSHHERLINTVKMTMLSQFSSPFNIISIKIPTKIFAEIDKPFLRFIWKFKEPRVTKAILTNNIVGRFILLDFNTNYKAIPIQTARYHFSSVQSLSHVQLFATS